MRIFISGGCKNGKSTLAQRLAKQQQNGALYYVATMASTGHEDDERITRQIEERAGWGFTTIEQPRNIGGLLEKCDAAGSFLLDSLTALLANEMFGIDGSFDEGALVRVSAELSDVLGRTQSIVVVSDYIYSDAAEYDPFTEAYRKSLAALDRQAAAACDVVLEAAYTNIIVHKGEAPHEAY